MYKSGGVFSQVATIIENCGNLILIRVIVNFILFKFQSLIKVSFTHYVIQQYICITNC